MCIKEAIIVFDSWNLKNPKYHLSYTLNVDEKQSPAFKCSSIEIKLSWSYV
jgi:hypothetical protein